MGAGVQTGDVMAVAFLPPVEVGGEVSEAMFLGEEKRTEVFPLPPADLTAPTTDLAPHADVDRAARGDPSIGNEEEL